MRHKIYIAGSLFTEAEIAQRLHEGQALAEVVGEENVFNPITNPFNDKRTLPEALHIFLGDYKVIRDEASIFLVNLDNPLDAGVMVELGQILQMKESGHDIEVIGVLSDIRVDTAGEYDGLKVPWGIINTS